MTFKFGLSDPENIIALLSGCLHECSNFHHFLRLETKCDLTESNQSRIRIQRLQKRIEMFISSGGQGLFFVFLCNQIRSNSSITRAIVFKFTRRESPDFHAKMYIWPPRRIRHLNIWIHNRLQWFNKSPSNSLQANSHFEFWNSDFRFVINDLKNLRNDCVYFDTHSQKSNAFGTIQVRDNCCAGRLMV